MPFFSKALSFLVVSPCLADAQGNVENIYFKCQNEDYKDPGILNRMSGVYQELKLFPNDKAKSPSVTVKPRFWQDVFAKADMRIPNGDFAQEYTFTIEPKDFTVIRNSLKSNKPNENVVTSKFYWTSKKITEKEINIHRETVCGWLSEVFAEGLQRDRKIPKDKEQRARMLVAKALYEKVEQLQEFKTARDSKYQKGIRSYRRKNRKTGRNVPPAESPEQKQKRIELGIQISEFCHKYDSPILKVTCNEMLAKVNKPGADVESIEDRFQLAQEKYQTLLRVQKAVDLRNQGNLLFEQKEFDEAIKKYDESVENDDRQPRIYLSLAAAHLKLNQFDQANNAMDRYQNLPEANFVNFDEETKMEMQAAANNIRNDIENWQPKVERMQKKKDDLQKLQKFNIIDFAKKKKQHNEHQNGVRN